MSNSITFKSIMNWEMAGLIFLIIFGSILHFTYEWSGFNPIVGMFSPVNESVWEHLKMGFWSLAIFSTIEYFFIHKSVNNFFMAKSLGILALELVIVVIFYAYTAVIGRSILFIDISLYVAGCAACQFIGYKLMTVRSLGISLEYINAGLIVFLALLFISFTYYTPKLAVFKDYNKNSYGTHWKINTP